MQEKLQAPLDSGLRYDLGAGMTPLWTSVFPREQYLVFLTWELPPLDLRGTCALWWQQDALLLKPMPTLASPVNRAQAPQG